MPRLAPGITPPETQRMLEELDAIPWGDLSHAYGPADDLPDLLRAIYRGGSLQTGSPKAGNPLGELAERIVHQGTLYEATSHVVPFLIDLLRDTKRQHRADFLYLLAWIATGDAFDYQLEQATHEAVANGCETYYRIAGRGKEDPFLRHVAASLLTWFGWEPTHTSTLVCQLVVEAKDPSQRAGLLLLLGHLGDKRPETISMLLNTAREGAPIEKACAVAALHLARAFPLPKFVRELAVEFVRSTEFDKYVESAKIVPYAEVSRDLLLAELTEKDKQALILSMVEQLEQGDFENTNTRLLVSLVFPACHDRRPIDPAKTTPLQKRLAAAIANGPQELRLQGRVDLPCTDQGWANLAKGLLPPEYIHKATTAFVDPDDRSTKLDPWNFTVGQRIHHDIWKLGTVEDVAVVEDRKQIEVDFEGTRRTLWVG